MLPAEMAEGKPGSCGGGPVTEMDDMTTAMQRR
jgi:hypothetical protein